MDDKLKSLKKFNLIMGFFHFVQALGMLYFASSFQKAIDFKPEIYSNFLKFDYVKKALVNVPEIQFLLPYAILVSVFLFLSAFFHFLVSSKFGNKKYNEEIQKGINSFRWYEYALSSSLMIVLIAVLFGVNDIGSLILIFGINASMNLFGLLMEKINQNTQKTDWSAFVYGAIAGIIPWIVILMYAFGHSNLADVPWFVYAIVSSYFVFFNLFPINMILQYRKVGKWKDYMFGERMYIILSLVAKSVLAWLVFFGIMQP